MQLTKNYHVGICFFIICFLSIILAGVFPTYYGCLPISIALSVAFATLACFMFIAGCVRTFDENTFIDTDELKSPIKISFKYLSIVFFVVIGWFLWSNPFTPVIQMYNTNIEYVNSFDKVQLERKMFYDKMWKTYLAKHEICELNRETFITVTSIIMEGRADGENVSWKIVRENQQIPYNEFTIFYKDLSTFVTNQREQYYNLEREAMTITQKQNSMLDSFPNNFYNKILGIKKLKYDPGFTSTKTEKVFKSKIEDF